jgi:hypothetical protein
MVADAFVQRVFLERMTTTNAHPLQSSQFGHCRMFTRASAPQPTSHPLQGSQFSHCRGESRLIAPRPLVREQREVNVRGRRKGPEDAGAEKHYPFDVPICRKRLND